MLSMLPNIITCIRIAGTACLLFIKPFTFLFYAIYTVAGLSDALDGWVARKTNTASEFGSKLDSIADLMFYAVMLIRIFPVLWKRLPREIWIAVALILILRACVYITAAFKYRRFASQHTWLNKATGAAIFAIAYIIKLSFAVPLCWIICAIAAASSTEELLIHLTHKEYRPEVKTFFSKT